MLPTRTLLLTALSASLAASGAVAQNAFTVNTLADTVDVTPGDGLALDANGATSLRAAIQEANALGGSALVRLAEKSSYTLGISGADEDAAATGDLDVSANITLVGNLSSLDAAGLDRAFDVLAGGRLYAVGLTLSNGSVTAQSGGAIRSRGDLFLIRSSITNSSALGAGASGGALFNDGGLLVVEDCDLSFNASERAGGAIEGNAGTTLVDDTSMTMNTSGPGPGNGGALHLTGAGVVDVRDCEISGNTASREGGGLWNSAVGAMSVDGCSITGNSADGVAVDDGGGGIFNDGGTLMLGTTLISGNMATTGSGSGGGLFNREGAAYVVGSEIENNDSNRAGGGIEAVAGFTALANVDLSDNSSGTSPGNGGGLHLTGAGIVDVAGSRILANSASAEGGGLWNSAVGQMTVTKSVLRGNVASGDDADQGGGALFNDGGTLHVLSTLISLNQADGASGSGGGILNNQGVLDVTTSRLIMNHSNRAGGGIEANVGTTILDSVVLSRNSTGAAPGNGGGLHLTGAGDVAITGGVVRLNDASNEGGGLWNSATGVMTVTGATIDSNTSPVGPDLFNDGGTFTVDGTPVAPGP